MDHRFNDRAVLPAVEAMEILAGAVATAFPRIDIHRIDTARFEKFLPLDQPEAMELWARLDPGAEGGVRAVLQSKRRGRRGIARTLTHAEMRFGGSGDGTSVALRPLAADPVDALWPSPEQIYTELVPFGHRYRNLSAIIAFTPDGIGATITAPAIKGPFQLGSGFVLDAAFHAACVWAQRYAGVVAFPVGLDRRQILRPCISGERYAARVCVRQRAPSLLVFDMAIEQGGRACEAVSGVQMRDVSGGRRKPPNWIRIGAGNGAGV